MKINIFKIIKFFSFLFVISFSFSYFLFFYFSNYTYKFNSNKLNYSFKVKDFNNFYIDINIDLSKYTKDEIYGIIFKLLKKEKTKTKNIYDKFTNYIYKELNKNSLNYPDAFLFFNETITTEINKNYYLRYYFKILKLLKKNNLNLYIKINLYNLKDFKENLYYVINEKILKNENGKILLSKLGGISLLNFLPDDYFKNIDAKVFIKLYSLKNQKNQIIENINLNIKNKYLGIVASFNQEKTNININSILNSTNLTNDFRIYNLNYSLKVESFPIFKITFKLNLPLLVFKNDYYSIFVKNLATYFIFKNEYTFYLSLKNLIFNNNINKININNFNMNLSLDFSDLITSKIYISKLIFNKSKGRNIFFDNTKLFLRIFLNKNFNNLVQNDFVIFADVVNIKFNNNLKINFRDAVFYVNNIDYNNKYFDLDFASKDYKVSLNIKSDKFNLMYFFNNGNYGVINKENENLFGILNFSILSISNILSIIKDINPIFSNENMDKIINFINKNFINKSEIFSIIFKDVSKEFLSQEFQGFRKSLKSYSSKSSENFYKYSFTILFPMAYFKGNLIFNNTNNSYSLYSIYSFYDVNLIKKLYSNYIDLNRLNLNASSLINFVNNSTLFGSIYLIKNKDNFDFSVSSFLFSNNFNNSFIASYLKTNNFKNYSLNILANIFDNYFSIFSDDFGYFNISGNIFNFNNLISLNKFNDNITLKQSNFNFSLNFNIFNKTISDFYLFISKLYFVYTLNKRVDDYFCITFNDLFVKIDRTFSFNDINYLINNNMINDIRFLSDLFIFKDEFIIIGNLNYYSNALGKVELFFEKILNNNLKVFFNIYDYLYLNDLNLNVVISKINNNYVFNGVMWYYNRSFLIENIISYFNIGIYLGFNSFTINFADFKGNLLSKLIFNNIKKEYLFDFSLNIQRQDNNYLANLFLGCNYDINFFKLNFITTLDTNDIKKNKSYVLDLLKLKKNNEILKFIYKTNFLNDIDRIWQKTYFNLTFDNYFFDILNYFKSNNNLQLLKFLYLKEYNLRLIKTPEIFLFKLNSINNNIIQLDFSLSSDKNNTFLYLTYLFDKINLLDISLKIKDYSLLYAPNLLAIYNKNINFSINLYPFSLVLVNLYSDILFNTNLEFFYNLANNFYNDKNIYDKSILNFNFDGIIFIDNLKKIDKIKINSIIFNLNLNNFYIFSFKEFKIIDLNLSSNLNLKFNDLYITLSEISNKKKLHKIFNDFIIRNTFLNFEFYLKFYFTNLNFSEPVYLSSFNNINITLSQNKYLCSLNINLPFTLFKIIPISDKNYKFLNNYNNTNLNDFLNSMFISFILDNFYIDKNNINFSKKENLLNILELILKESKIKLNALLFYYNYEFDFNLFFNQNYNLSLKINLFENNKNIGYINLNDIFLNNLINRKMELRDILKNTELFIANLDLFRNIINSTGSFNLYFKDYNLNINFDQFSFNYMNNNLKINDNLNITFNNNYFYFNKLPTIFINNSKFDYNINANNNEILLVFNIDLKKINAGIFTYEGTTNFNGSILFKNNKLEISIFSKFNKGELKISKYTSQNKKSFLYNYIDKFSITVNANNIKNKNIIWDVKFNSNLDINLKQLLINGDLKINKGTLRLNDGIYRIVQGNINWNNNLYGDMYILAQKLGTSPFDYKLVFVKGNIKDFIISNFNLYQEQKNTTGFSLSYFNNLSNNLSFSINDFMGLDIIDYSNNKTTGYIRVGKEIIKNIFVFYLRKMNKSNFENLDYDYYISIDYLIRRFSRGVLLINSTFYNNSKNNFGFIFVYGF